MKFKNILISAVSAVLFAFIGTLVTYAADDELPYGLQKKGKVPYGLTKPKKGEAGNLFFNNRTPYKVKIYSAVRNANDSDYSSSTTFLGEIPATGASTNFAIPTGGLLGRKNTKYEIEIVDKNGKTLEKKDFKFKLKNKNDSYSEKIKFKEDEKEIKLKLNVKYDKQSGLDMELTPA